MSPVRCDPKKCPTPLPRTCMPAGDMTVLLGQPTQLTWRLSPTLSFRFAVPATFCPPSLRFSSLSSFGFSQMGIFSSSFLPSLSFSCSLSFLLSWKFTLYQRNWCCKCLLPYAEPYCCCLFCTFHTPHGWVKPVKITLESSITTSKCQTQHSFHSTIPGSSKQVICLWILGHRTQTVQKPPKWEPGTKSS